jgi:hypothetical protein
MGQGGGTEDGAVRGYKSVARIPTRRRDAKRKGLATPYAKGNYRGSSLGPSFRQGCAVEAADGGNLFGSGCVCSWLQKQTWHLGRSRRSSAGSALTPS